MYVYYRYPVAWALQLPWMQFALMCMVAYVVVLYGAYTVLCRACGWHKGVYILKSRKKSRDGCLHGGFI